MKSVALGNGQMMILLDARGQVRDFFFPYVGLENHMGGYFIHRMGVHVDNRLRWFSDPSWNITVSCADDTLASNIIAENPELQVKLEFVDVIYNEKCIFLRKIKVTNYAESAREIKVFFCHEFEIMESHRGDTAYYDPIGKRVIHYKGRRVFLINAQVGDRGFDQYSTGQFGVQGKEGTYRDAEDGLLEFNPIQHGRVDSVVGITLTLGFHEEQVIYYWITAGTSIKKAQELDEYVHTKTPEHIIQTTQDYWHAWVKKQNFDFCDVDVDLKSLFNKSLLLIRTHIDNNGSVLASGDSDMLHHGYDTYSYMWPRDGSFVTCAMIKAGYVNLGHRFFEFCSDVITQDGYLMHKYRPDGSLGSSWHAWIRNGKVTLPIQEDETALVLYALGKYYEATRDLEFIESIYSSFIELAAGFLTSYTNKKTGLPHPTYDLWEEKYGVHTFTCATVYAALKTAAHFADILGKRDEQDKYNHHADTIREGILKYLYTEEDGFVKMVNFQDDKVIYDRTLDLSSFYGIYKFNVLPLDDPRVVHMRELIEKRLRCHNLVDGYCRFEGDVYFYSGEGAPGNPWFITTLWIAQYQIATAKSAEDLKQPFEWMKWAHKNALKSGVMSEQMNPFTGARVSATPLTWSHAEYVTTFMEYIEKMNELGICKANPHQKIGG
jgi:GH15 family glucan-1,4-alpha-glucosidase